MDPDLDELNELEWPWGENDVHSNQTEMFPPGAANGLSR
jgi:hypothetical protein